MLNEFEVLKDVSNRLTRAGIRYMLTGSLAMNYYSVPRMTRDVDLVVEVTAKDVETIVSIFDPDYDIERISVARAIDYERSFNIIHNEAFIKVDCIVRKTSDYRELEFQRRQEVSIQGFKVWLVSKEDLIISKLHWARDSHSELQLRDVKNLLASGFDFDYLSRWTHQLELSSLFEECLRND